MNLYILKLCFKCWWNSYAVEFGYNESEEIKVFDSYNLSMSEFILCLFIPYERKIMHGNLIKSVKTAKLSHL